MTELPSWIPMGTPSSSAAVPDGVVGAGPTASGRGRGWAGRRRPGSRARSTARRSSAAAAAGSCSGQHGRAEQPGRVRRRSRRPASRCRPRAMADGGGGVVDGPEVQPDRGVEHGLVDALGVHVGQPGHRVATRRAGPRPGGGTSRGRRRRSPGVARVPSGTARISVPPTTTCSKPWRVAPRSGAGAPRGAPAQARAGSTTWPSASTTGPARGGDAAVAVRRAAHGAGRRQSSAPGSGWRNSRAALPPAICRSSSSGRCPRVVGQHGLGVGPGRVGVGVVALHHDVVDADPWRMRDDRGVVDGAEPEVAAQHLARAAAPRARPRLSVPDAEWLEDVVDPVHQHRHPADAPLGHGHGQVGEAQGHAGPQPFGRGHEGVHREEGGEQLEGRVGRGERGPRRGPGVQADDGAGLLAGGEEGVPVRR